MPCAKMSSLPIDRDSVAELKEKLLGLQVENETELSENGVESNDEGPDDINYGETTFPEVALLLDGMGMKKYIRLFKQEKIDLNTFLSLTERDLIEIGVVNKKDRNVIIRNLGEQREPCTEFIMVENHTDDYQIIKNIQNHMVLIQNYCAYVECQTKKNKLVDYSITSNETALTYFKQFTKAAIKQSEIISNIVFQQNSSNNLIGKLLEANKLVLPQDLKQKLISKRGRERKTFIHIVGFIGLSVALLFAAKKLLKKNN